MKANKVPCARTQITKAYFNAERKERNQLLKYSYFSITRREI